MSKDIEEVFDGAIPQYVITDKIDEIKEFLDDLTTRTYEEDNTMQWYEDTMQALREALDKINSRL